VIDLFVVLCFGFHPGWVACAGAALGFGFDVCLVLFRGRL
jgi:hypothetical protein